ncbi:MAG: type II secretion system protein [Armatimonadetes bacterium]|nr:MAG: type II secretion system protein [Armatimonadota bacterium]
MLKKTIRGFTLVELLVVIAIVAILAAVVVLIINPIELTRRSRDAARLTDLNNLQQAINVAAQEATSSGVAILCSGMSGAATPGTVLCQGNSNSNGGNSADRTTDGTGWVKVDLSSQKSVSVPTLPVDPINDATYYYTYASDGAGWEINAVLESEQQVTTQRRMATDGGDNDDVFEVGSTLVLIN